MVSLPEGPDSKRRSQVAIIGGGFTGATAAFTLAQHGISVTVFDQGRRGPGGRASHRRVQAVDHAVLPDDDPPLVTPVDGEGSAHFEFDHGAQFFRADTKFFRTMVDEWCAKGWAAKWEGRFGCVDLRKESDSEKDTSEFFGLPSSPPFFVGVGGMQMLPRALLSAAEETGLVKVCRGVRVQRMERSSSESGSSDQWQLSGPSGEGAYHDTAEAVAAKAKAGALGSFDAVLVTDISASFDGWHRASAGVPEQVAKKVRGRVRIPLFAAMVALPPGISISAATGLDAFSVQGDDVLWFAGRTRSKPGYTSESDSAGECWTLVSTPSYTVAEIQNDTMRDEKTGEFKPQTNEYLQSVPGPALLAAFEKAVMLKTGTSSILKGQKPLYLQAQRWGSAMPAPQAPGDTVTTLGTTYDRSIPLLVPAADEINRVEQERKDFVADDELRCYYAGDYCSTRTPGIEAAVLSAHGAAQHIAAALSAK